MTTHKVVRRARQRRNERGHAAEPLVRLRAALAKRQPAYEPEYLTRIPIRDRTSLVMVPASHVAIIVANGERLTITTLDHQQHSLLYRLKDLETRLDPAAFIRLNRGVVVNLNVIARIIAGSSGTSIAVLESGQELPMSRIQSQRLRRVLQRLLR